MVNQRQTPKGMLEKLRRELMRLIRAKSNESAEDHAMNCALTAFHVLDYVWHTHFKDSAKARSCIGISAAGNPSDLKREFTEYLTDQSPALRLCQDLAHGFKHVQAWPIPHAKHPGVAGTETKGVLKVIDGPGYIDEDGVLNVPFPAAVTVTTERYDVWITDDKGNSRDARETFQDAREFWGTFLDQDFLDKT